MVTSNTRQLNKQKIGFYVSDVHDKVRRIEIEKYNRKKMKLGMIATFLITITFIFVGWISSSSSSSSTESCTDNSTDSFINTTTRIATTIPITTEERCSSSNISSNILQNSVTATTAIGNYISYDEIIQIYAYANLSDNTVTFEIIYYGEPTWIALGFSTTGEMIDSIAVVGQQKQTQKRKQNNEHTIQQYLMTSKELSGIVLMKSSSSLNTSSTIVNKMFIQNNTHTYIKFTRPIINDDSLPDIYISSANTKTTNNQKKNILLYAYGYDNTFSYHIDRASFILDIFADNTEVASNTTTSSIDNNDKNYTILQSQPNVVVSTTINTNTNTNTTSILWLLHGVCMTIAWIILIPLGIFSSQLRYVFSSKVSPDKWFQIHQLFNIVGVVITIKGFIIGYIASNKSKSIFSNSHKKLGVYITLIVLLQAINGIIRPKVKVPTTKTVGPATKQNDEEEIDTSDDDLSSSDDDDVSSSSDDEKTTFIVQVTTTTKTLTNPVAENNNDDNNKDTVHDTYGSNTYNNKSSIMKHHIPASLSSTAIQRLLWVYCHRIIGYVILVVAIYNCYTGTVRYDTKHNTHYTTIVILFASILYCPILILIVVSKFSVYRTNKQYNPII